MNRLFRNSRKVSAREIGASYKFKISIIFSNIVSKVNLILGFTQVVLQIHMAFNL